LAVDRTLQMTPQRWYQPAPCPSSSPPRSTGSSRDGIPREPGRRGSGGALARPGNGAGKKHPVYLDIKRLFVAYFLLLMDLISVFRRQREAQEYDGWPLVKNRVCRPVFC